jgi:tRNA A37 threonylcarbamoyladenosine synthetase subunit TsaC/SUA5/YrdC
MKTILTIIFIIFLSFTAQAQKATNEVKVETIEMAVVTETTYELNLEAKTEVARLYKSKNSKIKKELNFITKANKAKMA